MDEIVMLIRLDTAIAARVLQVSNSPYYNQGLRCHTIDEASIVSGTIISTNSSLTRWLAGLVRPLEVYSMEADEIWQQSVACALAAELIASITGDDENVAYTVGCCIASHGGGQRVGFARHPQLRFIGEAFPVNSSGASE